MATDVRGTAAASAENAILAQSISNPNANSDTSKASFQSKNE